MLSPHAFCQMIALLVANYDGLPCHDCHNRHNQDKQFNEPSHFNLVTFLAPKMIYCACYHTTPEVKEGTPMIPAHKFPLGRQLVWQLIERSLRKYFDRVYFRMRGTYTDEQRAT